MARYKQNPPLKGDMEGIIGIWDVNV
jgi:hypothetical protein